MPSDKKRYVFRCGDEAHALIERAARSMDLSMTKYVRAVIKEAYNKMEIPAAVTTFVERQCRSIQVYEPDGEPSCKEMLEALSEHCKVSTRQAAYAAVIAHATKTVLG